MAATSNNKTLLGIKEEGKQKKQINRSSICGKKLKKEFQKKKTSRKGRSTYIEDTQRLVTEIEILKVVLNLVSRKQR